MMCTTKILILLLIFRSVLSEAFPRIVGGFLAEPGQFPFSAALRENKKQYCSGSIIHKKWILTAAHCVPADPENITALVGTVSQTSGGLEHKISKALTHKSYIPVFNLNDIGLVRVKNKFQFGSLVQPIRIGNAIAGTVVTAIGWGKTETETYPDVLKFVRMKVIGLKQCRKIANMTYDFVRREHLCTIKKKGTGMCNGDSGGPMVANGKLVGISSFTIGGCAGSVPDIATRPIHYLKWITDEIGHL